MTEEERSGLNVSRIHVSPSTFNTSQLPSPSSILSQNKRKPFVGRPSPSEGGFCYRGSDSNHRTTFIQSNVSSLVHTTSGERVLVWGGQTAASNGVQTCKRDVYSQTGGRRLQGDETSLFSPSELDSSSLVNEGERTDI